MNKFLTWFPVVAHAICVPMLLLHQSYITAWFAFAATWFALQVALRDTALNDTREYY